MWKSELDSFIVHHTQHSTGHIHCHLPVVEVKTYKAESTWCIQILSSQGVPRIFDCEGKLRTPSHDGSPVYRFRANIATRISPAKSNTMLEKKKKKKHLVFLTGATALPPLCAALVQEQKKLGSDLAIWTDRLLARKNIIYLPFSVDLYWVIFLCRFVWISWGRSLLLCYLLWLDAA